LTRVLKIYESKGESEEDYGFSRNQLYFLRGFLGLGLAKTVWTGHTPQGMGRRRYVKKQKVFGGPVYRGQRGEFAEKGYDCRKRVAHCRQKIVPGQGHHTSKQARPAKGKFRQRNWT